MSCERAAAHCFGSASCVVEWHKLVCSLSSSSTPSTPAQTEEGCGALCNLSIDAKDRRINLTVPGGLQAVVAAMRAHVTNVEAQEAGCAALWSLAEADQLNREAIRGTGACDVVCRAMEKHVHNIPLQAVGGSALLCFCQLGNADEVALASGVEVIMAGLRLHGQVVSIQEVGIEALGLLARSSPETLVVVQESGAEEVVKAAVETRFPQHEGIQRAGRATLEAFPSGGTGLLG